MNGASPTLWLQDDRGGEEVAAALWEHPEVIDIAKLPERDQLPPLPEEVPNPEVYYEGASRKIAVNAYERDPKARARCIDEFGYQCAACGLMLATVYGEDARKLIHVHHVRPLASLGRKYEVDPLRDLVPVCPNCHAVIHIGGGCRSIEEVQEMIERARTSA